MKELTISKFIEDYRDELVKRFQLDGLKSENCREGKILGDIAQRYASTFMNSPEVGEKYPNRETLCFQTALHCFHGGLCVALYELTEEDFELTEKTFDILTHMDTVFFSGLLLTRWNVKKRCINYKTDFLAESMYKVLQAKIAKTRYQLGDFPELTAAMALIFLAGAVTDVTKLEEPYADLSGID